MTYSISRAELGQMSLEAPADYKVVNVFDANVRQWSVEPPPAGGKQQKIAIQLFEPAKQRQQVCIELEKFAAPATQARLVAPVVKALGVGRQEGIVVVQAAPGLRAEAVAATGLLQIDAAELPATLRWQPWTFSYRYAAIPYEFALSVEQLRPRITTESLVQAHLEPERLTLDVYTAYNIERAGVFKLEFDVPPGYDVRRVRGCEVGAPGGAAAQVDSHHIEGEKKSRLVVNLSRKAIGRVGLFFQLQKDLQEPKLLAPTDQAADIALPVPQVAADTVERAAGKVVVYAAGQPAGESGKERRAAEHLVRRGRWPLRAAAASGRQPSGFGLRLRSGADRPPFGRGAEKTPGHDSSVACGEGRARGGEVSRRRSITRSSTAA